LELKKAKYFMSRDVTFDETQMTMMCKDIEKGKERVYVGVKPFTNGSNYLETSNDKALNDVDQHSTSYTRRPKRA